MIDIKQLIEGILVDLTNDKPITSIMYKCQTLAYYLNDSEFSLFVKHEQNGYQSSNSIPEYRIIHTGIKADISFPMGRFIKNFDYPTDAIPNKVIRKLCSESKISEPLARIEELYNNTDSTIQIVLPASTLNFLSQGLEDSDMTSVIAAHQYADKTALKQIIENVKQRLLDFFLNLNDEITNIDFNVMNNSQKLSKIVHQTFNNCVLQKGENNSINAHSSNIGGHGNNISVELSNEDIEELKRLTKNIEEKVYSDEDLALTLKGVLTTIAAQLKQPKPSKDILNTSFCLLRDLAVGISSSVIATQIMPFIHDALTLL